MSGRGKVAVALPLLVYCLSPRARAVLVEFASAALSYARWSNGSGPAAGGDVLHLHLRHTAVGQRPRRGGQKGRWWATQSTAVAMACSRRHRRCAVSRRREAGVRCGFQRSHQRRTGAPA